MLKKVVVFLRYVIKSTVPLNPRWSETSGCVECMFDFYLITIFIVFMNENRKSVAAPRIMSNTSNRLDILNNVNFFLFEKIHCFIYFCYLK